MKLSIALVAALLIWSSASAARADIVGTWLSQSGETKVRIAPCGGGKLCGTVVWAKGDPKDTRNPRAARRTRPVRGIRMIWDIKPTGSAGEYTGKLYNYKDGKTYDGKVSEQGASRLKLSGCVLGGMICRGQIWSRIE